MLILRRLFHDFRKLLIHKYKLNIMILMGKPSSRDNLLILSLFKFIQKITGRTKLQKLCFILKLSGIESKILVLESVKFDLLYYGPFSKDLNDIMTTLKDEKLININQQEIGDSIEDPDGKIIRYNYEITKDGKSKAEEAFDSLSEDEKALVKNIVKLDSLTLSSLLDKVYKTPQVIKAKKEGFGTQVI